MPYLFRLFCVTVFPVTLVLIPVKAWIWNDIFNVSGVTYVYSLLEDANGYIYAGSNKDAVVYKSVNGGLSWDPKSNFLEKDAKCLILASDGYIYCGTGGTIMGRIFKTNNGGDIWTQCSTLPGASTINCLLDASDGYIYLGTSVSSVAKVYRTNDGGTTWLSTGSLGNATYVYCLLEDSAGVIYTGTGATYGDVYKTVDGGTNWTNTGDLSGAQTVSCLIQTLDGKIYAGTGSTNGDVFTTVNGGTSWTNTGNLAGVSNVAALLEASDGKIYAGTGYSGKVFYTGNSGTSWSEDATLSGADYIVSMIESDDYYLYASNGWMTGNVYKTETAIMPTPTPGVTQTPSCIHHGDVDFSGTITAGDAQLAFFITMGTYTPTYEEQCAADCNGDGSVTAGDAQNIFAAIFVGSCADPL